jgi:hypothetical protein
MSFGYHTLSSADLDNLSPATRAELTSYLSQRDLLWMSPPRMNPPAPYNTLTIQPIPWQDDQLGTPPASPVASPVLLPVVPPVVPPVVIAQPIVPVILNPEDEEQEVIPPRYDGDDEWTNEIALEARACRLLMQALPALRPLPTSDHLKEMENTLMFIQMNNLEENILVAPRMAELRSAITDLRAVLALYNLSRPGHLGVSI